MSDFESAEEKGTEGLASLLVLMMELSKKGLDVDQMKSLLRDFSEFLDQVVARTETYFVVAELNTFLAEKGWSITIEPGLLELCMRVLESLDVIEVTRHNVQ